jgi:hypothetical protein
MFTTGGDNMNEITTTDLAQFGHREKAMAAKLLTAMQKGSPEDFYEMYSLQTQIIRWP